MTDAEKTALDNAIATVRAQQGLNDIPATWSYDQRIAYNKALAAYIQQNPTSYAPETVTTAGVVSAANYTALDDTSYLAQVSLFSSTFWSKGVDIFNGLSTLTKFITVAVALASIAYIVYAFKRK